MGRIHNMQKKENKRGKDKEGFKNQEEAPYNQKN